MRAPTETEFKLKSLANIQLKFSPVESPALFTKKLRVVCGLLDISLGAEERLDITDEYFDDAEFSLWKRRCTFRRRLSGVLHRVTFKAHDETSVPGAVQRIEDEFDCTDAELRELLGQPERIRRRIRDRLNLEVRLGEARKVLSIQNRRLIVPLQTTEARYALCYDKYYYFDKTLGRFSEYFAEIEIEFEGDSPPGDHQLTKLREALSQLLNYAPGGTTKLERGLAWARGEARNLITVYVVAFDIVAYSRQTADLQKQQILTLNRLTKEVIREIRGSGAEEEVIYIPTGDGMVLVFETNPETIVPIVFSLQERVKEYSATKPGAGRFSFRTGLHAGPVFKYSDVNENLNFAGNGINLAVRAMALGDDWQILATREGYETLGRISRELATHFVSVGQYVVKHGQPLDIFNVFDPERQCGNPARPEG